MASETTYTIKAKITLYTPEMGGRKKPIYSGYRRSFSFNSSRHYSGELRLIGKKELHPGESSWVSIHLLPASTIRKNLRQNDAFIIAEGNKAVGTGVIDKVEVL